MIMSFIKTPNLPQNNVTKLICGNLVKPYESELNKLGAEVVYGDDNAVFDTPLKSHADLFVNYIGDGKIILDASQKGLKNKLEELGFTAISAFERVENTYPSDCRLNCVITNDIIICNKALTDKSVLDFAVEKALKLINVKQGYCKCSVLPVNGSAFITDDEGIYKALKAEKLDALYVEKGSVALKGYSYGFIGGCAGKIANDIIAFCGNIRLHKSYEDIKSFIKNYGIEAVSLSDGELSDVGSLIPIIEK